MEIKNQIKQFKKIIHSLYLEHKWETSKLGRFIRAIRFHLGFSQCRYCIYFQPEYGDHRTQREEAILTKGKCDWSNIAGVDIDKKMATKLKRCDAFTPVLFNIKGYVIAKKEVKSILLQRRNYLFSWLGIIVSIIAATVACVTMLETKKERAKAEKAFAAAQIAQYNAEVANKNSEEIGKFLTKLIMVDNALGYRIDSFKIREEVAPLLRKKAVELMNKLNIKINDDLPDIVEEWIFLPKDSEERKLKWNKIKKNISELLEEN